MKSRSFGIFIIIVLLLLGAGWLTAGRNNRGGSIQTGQGGAPVLVISGSVTPKRLEIPLNPVDRNVLDQSGTAILEDENGKVKVSISVNAADDKNQPVHIHSGVCPGVGQIIYPLNNVIDGKSVTTVNTSMSNLLAQLPLAVNLHKSPSELSVYTSCGDIIRN